MARKTIAQIGDQLQSAASRLASWAKGFEVNAASYADDIPYEVYMAALEAESAVEEWTDLRCRTIDPETLEECAAAAHDEWMAEKQRRGVESWYNEAGIEQMVPYAYLDESIRDFDRVVVGAIIDRMQQLGVLPDGSLR